MFTYTEWKETEQALCAYFADHKRTEAINFFGRTEKVPNILKKRYIEELRNTKAFGIKVVPDEDGFSQITYFACDVRDSENLFFREKLLDKIMFPYFSEYGYYQSSIKYIPDVEAAEQVEPPAELFKRYTYFCFDSEDREQILSVLKEVAAFSPEKIEEIAEINVSYFTLADTYYPWVKKYEDRQNPLANSCFSALRESETPFIEITDRNGFISSRNMICEMEETPFHKGYRLDLRRTVRSSWEANVTRILNALNVPYEYERESYKVGEDFYLPDFFLANNTILEVKGFWDNESRKKIAGLQKEHPEFKILPVDSDMYESLKNKFANNVSNWEECGAHKPTAEKVAIVGMKFCADKVTISRLSKGHSLTFKREPDNQFDRNAILVQTEDGKPIGHLSGDWAAVYAPKMDCGMKYSATVFDIQPKVIIAKMWRTNTEEEVLYECFK